MDFFWCVSVRAKNLIGNRYDQTSYALYTLSSTTHILMLYSFWFFGIYLITTESASIFDFGAGWGIERVESTTKNENIHLETHTHTHTKYDPEV